MVCHPAHQLRSLWTHQAVQRHLGEVGASRPRWAEVGPKGQQRQDAGCRALIDEQAEEFQRGRIDPVQVFYDQEDRLLGGHTQQDRQQGVQQLPLVLLGREALWGIGSRQQQSEEGIRIKLRG